ncbi:MAG: beta-hydroxyacyl-ACP dehydratase [Phycisphaerales bacterium]|nr:MAG: beta-hydroxyacyl-ACP dehydratase [Phycisphaerales bacterium]
MKFALLDRIIELEPGTRIRAVKSVTASEEYLQDHFPTFPVLPGVLMLEALTEAARWLVHVSQDFRHSVILLADARNVTYKSFVTPGDTLEVDVVCRELAEDHSTFAGSGASHGVEVVKARFGLRHFSLARRGPQWAAVDRELITDARRRLRALFAGPAGSAV